MIVIIPYKVLITLLRNVMLTVPNEAWGTYGETGERMRRGEPGEERIEDAIF